MKTETILLAAVGLYWLTRPRAAAASSPAAAASAPAKPTAPAAAAAKPRVGFELEQGHTYEARIQLTGVELIFGTAAAVRDKLTAAGFSSVVVTGQGNGAFTARGVWSKPSTLTDLPPQVREVHPA